MQRNRVTNLPAALQGSAVQAQSTLNRPAHPAVLTEKDSHAASVDHARKQNSCRTGRET